MHVRQTQHRHRHMRQIRLRVHHLKARVRRIVQHRRKRKLLAPLHQQRLLECKPIRIRKLERPLQQQRRPRHHRRATRIVAAFLHRLHHIRRIEQRFARRLQRPVHKRHHRLAFRHRLPRRLELIHRNARRVLTARLRNPLEPRIRPLLEVHLLVLHRMRQLMRKHGFLLIRLHPVQQIHHLGLGVVVARNLLRQQAQQKRLQVEAPVQQPEFLQHDLRPLQLLRALILVEALHQVPVHLIARNQPPLHLQHRCQARVVGHKGHDSHPPRPAAPFSCARVMMMSLCAPSAAGASGAFAPCVATFGGVEGSPWAHAPARAQSQSLPSTATVSHPFQPQPFNPQSGASAAQL